MSLTTEQTAKAITCLIVILCLAWCFGHSTWKNRKDEHLERCKGSYRYLLQRIRYARIKDMDDLEDLIDDFYAEYITLVKFETVRAMASELHAQHFNRRMELAPPKMVATR
jgi:predicted negative regulator of RcsB-dependent stress response